MFDTPDNDKHVGFTCLILSPENVSETGVVVDDYDTYPLQLVEDVWKGNDLSKYHDMFATPTDFSIVHAALTRCKNVGFEPSEVITSRNPDGTTYSVRVLLKEV